MCSPIIAPTSNWILDFLLGASKHIRVLTKRKGKSLSCQSRKFAISSLWSDGKRIFTLITFLMKDAREEQLRLEPPLETEVVAMTAQDQNS